jgi:nucleoside-diphosphate-sugar epimerase
VDEETTIAVNYEAAKMMARLSRAQGISRFVFASTCSVYGATDEIIDEQSELNPVSLYATTKIDAERALLEAVDEIFQPTILRLATAYGWSRRPRFDLVANLLSAKAVTDREISVFNGEQWRPFVNTRDIGRAIVAVLEAPLSKVGGEIFNVGDNSQNYTISELGQIVAAAVPGTKVHEVRNNEDQRNYRVKFDKIQNALDFRATVSLAEGIHEIVHAVRSDRAIDWRDPKYSNLKQMQSTVLKVLKFDLDDQESDLELQATRAFLRKAA